MSSRSSRRAINSGPSASSPTAAFRRASARRWRENRSGASAREEGPMEGVKDASHLYEVERRARHAERPGFRISELQISPTQQVPWHYHTNIQDTFYVLAGEIRVFCRDP